MNQEYLKSLLNNLTKEETEKTLHANSRVLLVDSMNTFIRCFAMVNHINPNGNHTGGLTGFIKSVAYAIRIIQPTKVVLVFDGPGSTTNKKNLYPAYKGNRNINRITNWDIFDNKDEEVESMANQLMRLVEYMKLLPVHMLSIEKIEADDVIGYLCGQLYDKCESIHIMSADTDFYQLVNDKVQVYSPVKKKFYTPSLIREEYGLHPHNYLTYKILMGDSADNLPGIEGLGKKKIAKIFPDIFGEKNYSLDELLKYNKTILSNHMINTRVDACTGQLKINEILMNIIEPNIDENVKSFILEKIHLPVHYNKMKFITMWNNDKLGGQINVDYYLDNNFKYLQNFKEQNDIK